MQIILEGFGRPVPQERAQDRVFVFDRQVPQLPVWQENGKTAPARCLPRGDALIRRFDGRPPARGGA
jgi:hypothetical protein